jgi:glycosyltransferase involved in cell wall biosynthesis
MKTAICTIIAKNYLPFARVLMESVRLWSPSSIRLVFLVDQPDGFFNPADEDFEVIQSDLLPIPDSRWFHFKYTILELSTAVKPFALEYVLDHYRVDQVLYFDPDIAIYGDLHCLERALDQSSIVLTPHLTSPLVDRSRPTDLDILRSGSYNLGFIGIRRSAETSRFLDWWKMRLYDQCVVDLPKGLFVDQRWIDLVPGMFSGVTILRDPSLNVAYWNLSHRTVIRSPKGYLVNGEPLCFFHFSGLNPDEPHSLSRHQNRFTLEDLGDVLELVLEYRDRLHEKGYQECRRWPYAYGVFKNGFRIPDMGRPAHHEVPEMVTRLSDPFSEEGFRAFVDLWNQRLAGPDGKPSEVTRLAYRIYRARTDVQQAMPDIFGGDLIRFLNWVLSSGQLEHNLSDVFVAPISSAIKSSTRREPLLRDRRPSTSPPVNERILGALDASGIWINSELGAVRVDDLNVLIGNGNAKLHLTSLARAIHKARPDLQQFFPDPCGRDSVRFLLWFLTYGAREYQLAEALLLPLRKQWDAMVGSFRNPLIRIWYKCILQSMSGSIQCREAARFAVRGIRRLSSRLARPWSGRRWEPIAPEADGEPRRKRHFETGLDGCLGANLVGYVRSEMGVGESMRCAIRAAQACGISVAIKGVDRKGPYRLGDRSFCGDEHEFPHNLNVFHANADEAEVIGRRLGSEFFRGRYNIGYWAWELEEFPDRWLPSFRLFDEIWTPSTFCQTAIARKSPVPVLRMPHAIRVDNTCNIARSEFSIPAEPFVFLVIFDLLSVSERKNPIGSIDAFRRAFADSGNCHLVLKISHAEQRPEQMASIRSAAAGLPVTIIDRTIDRGHVNSLIKACDCLLSLHRSEGFGLSIAEAMYLGRPVIVTNYSGNTDFARPGNAFLVDYDLVEVPSGCDPYDEGAVWAEPKLAHAVEQMRVVMANPEVRNERAGRASDFIRKHLAPEVVGALMRERMTVLSSGHVQRFKGPRQQKVASDG